MPRQTKIFCIIFVNAPVFLFHRQTVRALRGHEAKVAQQPFFLFSNCELQIAGHAAITANLEFTISRHEMRLEWVAIRMILTQKAVKKVRLSPVQKQTLAVLAKGKKLIDKAS